jgi:hypothetical protein
MHEWNSRKVENYFLFLGSHLIMLAHSRGRELQLIGTIALLYHISERDFTTSRHRLIFLSPPSLFLLSFINCSFIHTYSSQAIAIIILSFFQHSSISPHFSIVYRVKDET